MQIPQLKLSLPISAYTTAPITDLHHLCSRLSTHPLSHGWMRHMDATNSGLIFSSLSVDSSTLMPVTTFIVKVDNNLKWSLSYNGILVKNQQHNTFGNSQQIKCLSDVLTFLYSIQANHIYCGNSVEEFKQLVDDCGGEFKDLEGFNKLWCTCMVIYNLFMHGFR